MLNGYKMYTDTYFLIYLLIDPYTYLKADPKVKDILIPRGNNKLVTWLAKSSSMQRMLIWDTSYL